MIWGWLGNDFGVIWGRLGYFEKNLEWLWDVVGMFWVEFGMALIVMTFGCFEKTLGPNGFNCDDLGMFWEDFEMIVTHKINFKAGL